MIDPVECENSGRLTHYTYTQDELNAIVGFCYKSNIQIHCHVIGDLATSMVLNSLENSRQKYDNNNTQRNYLAHLELVQKSDFERIRDLGVSATFSSLWFSDEQSALRVLEMVGKHRIEGYFPIKSLMNMNIVCGVGSDWPVTEFNPFYAIEVALTHRYPGEEIPEGDLNTFNKNQILNIFEIIDAYTIESAKLLGLEKITGSLEIGKFLDMIVLDRDIFEIKANEIHKINVEETYLSGILVYKYSY